MKRTDDKTEPPRSRNKKRAGTRNGRRTRERILLASINLFSEQGYDAVSIREIAAAVGIKDSSIYRHFESKDSILDEILSYYISRSSAAAPSLEQTADRAAEIGLEQFFKEFGAFYLGFMSDPATQKIWRIIAIEQYHNEKIRRFFRDNIVGLGDQIFEELFRLMVERKLLKGYDPAVLSSEFFSFALYLYFKYFILEYDPAADPAEPHRKAWAEMERHIKFLIDVTAIDQ